MASDVKGTKPILTAESFAAAMLNGTIANIIRGNTRFLEAWNASQDAAPRVAPALDDILIPGAPAIPAVPAVLADPGLGIVAAPAIAAVAAVDDFLAFDHTAAGALSAAGGLAFRTAMRDYQKALEEDKKAANLTMKAFLDSFHEDLLNRVKDHNLVLANQHIDSNAVWSLSQLTLAAINQSNISSASAALHALLNQPSPIRAGDLQVLINHGPLRALCQNATNLLSTPALPDYISVNQLATYGFIKSLCAVRDREFISWFNTAYPTGICAAPLELLDRYKLFALAKSPDTVAMQNEEVAQMNFKRDERDLLAFFAKVQDTHGPGKMETLVTRCLQAKSPRLHALIAAGKGDSKGGGRKSDVKDKPSADVKGDVQHKPRVCSQCAKSFVPGMAHHSMCPTCFTKLKAIVAVTDTEFDSAGNATGSFVYLSPALASSSTSKLPSYWDNGASINLTSDLSLLEQIVDLPKPFLIGGPSSTMKMTKMGIMPALPANKNIAYYTPDANVTLLSIGNLCTKGGESHQTHTGLKLYDVSGPLPVLLDSSPALVNNLSPVSPDFWKTRRSGTGVNCKHWETVFTDDVRGLTMTPLLDKELWAYHSAPNPSRHYTVDELKRADEVQRLHEVYAHLNDHDLGVSLDHGLIRSPLSCTSRDVAINRVLRVNCPQCLEGKMKHPHYGPSNHQPATGIGETLHLDLNQLPVPAGGNS
jgi:hypothetical protein